MYTQKYYILKKNSKEEYYKGGITREVEEVNAFLSNVKTTYDKTENEGDAYKFKSLFKALLVKKYLGDNFVLVKMIYNQNEKKTTVYKQNKKYYILKKFDDNKFYKGALTTEKRPLNGIISIVETGYDSTQNEEDAYKFKSLVIALLTKRYLEDFILIKKERN